METTEAAEPCRRTQRCPGRESAWRGRSEVLNRPILLHAQLDFVFEEFLLLPTSPASLVFPE